MDGPGSAEHILRHPRPGQPSVRRQLQLRQRQAQEPGRPAAGAVEGLGDFGDVHAGLLAPAGQRQEGLFPGVGVVEVAAVGGNRHEQALGHVPGQRHAQRRRSDPPPARPPPRRRRPGSTPGRSRGWCGDGPAPRDARSSRRGARPPGPGAAAPSPRRRSSAQGQSRRLLPCPAPLPSRQPRRPGSPGRRQARLPKAFSACPGEAEPAASPSARSWPSTTTSSLSFSQFTRGRQSSLASPCLSPSTAELMWAAYSDDGVQFKQDLSNT